MIHILHRFATYSAQKDGTIQIPASRRDIEFRAQFAEPDNAELIRDGLAHGFYKFVASVQTDNLEAAYASSQHIEENWMDGPEIDAKVDGARSTSMGDILLDDVGNCHVVVMVGFREIVDAEIVAQLRALVR